MNWRYKLLSDFTDEQFSNAYNSLSVSKKKRVDKLKKQDDKKRSLAAEILLKQLLKEEYGINNPVVCHYDNGKPYVECEKICVSIAHSENMVVCAADFEDIGIDVEKIRPINKKLVSRVCQKGEEKYVLEDNDDFLYRFFEVWTAKEAYFKKLGTGITNLKSVNILSLPRQIFQINGYLVQII